MTDRLQVLKYLIQSLLTIFLLLLKCTLFSSLTYRKPQLLGAYGLPPRICNKLPSQFQWSSKENLVSIIEKMLQPKNRSRGKSKRSVGILNMRKQELFASILNSIAASVRWVSSTQVVLSAKQANQLRRTQTKEDDEKRRNLKNDIFVAKWNT